MLQPLARRRRRLSVIAATVLAFVLVPSASALAVPNYSLSVSDDGADRSVTDAFVFGTAADVRGPMRVVIRRNGTVVRDETGDYETFSGQAFSEVFFDALPAVGDLVELYNPGSSSTPAKTYTYTGRPSMISCPVGGRQIIGKNDPGTIISRAGAQRPSAQSGDPNRSNPGTVKQSGDDYTVTLQRNLAAGDRVFVSASRQVGANFRYFRSTSRDAGECAPESGGPVTTNTTTTTTTVQSSSPLNGVVKPLAKRDVKQGKNPRVVKVRVTCDATSTIPCAGTIGAQTVRRFARLSAAASAKRKRVTLATKRFSVAPGKTKVVTLKLKTPAYRLLKRQRRLKVRVSVVTKDSAGRRLATSRTLTLKYKGKKKSKS
jgi:hypothetical protein